MSEHILPTGEAKDVYASDLIKAHTDHCWDKYKFCTHAYNGDGGFASGDYIVKFVKETTTSHRKKLAYYKNYIKNVIDSMLVPVFSVEAQRSSDSVLFDAFVDNVDMKGTTIQDFTSVVVKYARIHGVCFVVMDNVSEDNMSDTLNEAIVTRSFPYMYYRTADEVFSFTQDDYGRLETISFIECEDGKDTIYKLWTNEYSVEYKVDKDEIIEVEPRVYHGLGVLPVISTYLDPDSNILPFPPIMDLAKLNWTIYNIDSEERSLLRQCAFPVLTLQSSNKELNMDLGADSVIVYGDAAGVSVNAPQWISPDVNILKVLNELSGDVVAKMIESAGVLGAQAVNSSAQAKSGVALSIEFMAQQFALQKTARMAERFETLVSYMFGMYTNTSINYEVKYRENYKPSQNEVEKKIAMYQSLLSINMSDEINAEIMKQLFVDVSDYFKWKDVDGLVNTINTSVIQNTSML